VHASNEARFEESFRDIADQVKIRGRQDLKDNIFKLVENWLRDEKNGKWICILDNADDHKFLCSLLVAREGPSAREPPNAPTKPLLEYIPRSQHGSLIITSRSREVALKMVKHRDLVEVNPMETSEALELLQKMLDQSERSQDSQKLVEELEFMPLAIVQAASYIRDRAPLTSVPQYLMTFQRNDREAKRLLKKEPGHLDRDWEASNSILVTWQISFDYIRREKPSAADLLSLMSFFDRQGIPDELLRAQHENNHISKSELSNRSSGDEGLSASSIFDDFEDDITTLRDFSFISASKNGAFFTMHRLVQLTTRIWLETHGQMERWKEIFISRLYYKVPTGEYENWEICRQLFPHVKAAMSQQPESQKSLQEWAALLYNGAWYALQSGIIADAKDMALISRKQRVRLLGEEHEDALNSTAILARAWSLQGNWENAERLEVQVMEIRKKIFSEDHPSTLTSTASLALTLWNQGRWEEAEELQMQVMKTIKAKPGEDYTETLTNISNLALTYCSQGRWGEAEELQVQVTEIQKTKVGDDHPLTMTSMANLASTYRNQGRWEEAEQLEVQVMNTSKMKLAEDHPDTLISMANLALTYCSQGRWEEAELLQVQVMEMSKTKLGDNHPDTLMSMANLALTYCDQGRWEEAEQLEVQVMETRKTKLGDDHPDTLKSISNLALTFWKQGQWKEAEQLQVQLMKMSKAKLGEDHPDTLAYISNLALTYCNQRRWEEAELLQVQVMEMSKTKLGDKHPDTLKTMANLASTFWFQRRWEEAEKLQVQVMETRKTKLGEDHPDTLKSLANLASTFWTQRRWEEAEKLQVQVVETRKTKLGEDHPDTVSSMANLAFTWKYSGQDAKAINLLRYCLTKQKQIFGVNHWQTLANTRALAVWEMGGSIQILR
jgi:putative hemolysin